MMEKDTDFSPCDYAMERRLRALNPGLHRRFTETVFSLQYYLSRYRLLFPEYSDHSDLHSLTVVDFCNRLLGGQMERLNADELYALLMGCYLHDTGMGITIEQYREFSGQIDFGHYFDTHSRDDYATVIRDYHHELSGLFIRRYARLFDIPSEAHLRAIVQIARGHRKTDLMDEAEYPAALQTPGGNPICLPYLASLIRLADEIDVAAPRNPALLFDIGALTDETEIMINSMILAVKRLDMTESDLTLIVDTPDQKVYEELKRMAVKMQQVLDYCRGVVARRTPFAITQTHIALKTISP